MPIKHAIWTVGENPAPLALRRLASEQQLEEMIVADPRILASSKVSPRELSARRLTLPF